MRAPPLFVHSWWRSGSTYLWAKLRQDPGLRCYYEPLNERLEHLSSAELEKDERAVSRALRHPAVQAHYFAEYAGLLQAQTLGYTRDLAHDRYLLRPQDKDDALRGYIQRLDGDAREHQLRPVFCFCRSQMRSAWLRESFDALHVAQLRNPESQLASFGVTHYFSARLRGVAVSLRRNFPDAFASLPEDDMLMDFSLVWMASTLQAISAADCVVDIDRVTSDSFSRDRVRRWFADQGCDIDLGDCNMPGAASADALRPTIAAAIQAAASALRTHAKPLALFDAERVASKVAELSGASREAIEYVLN